jgi:hypothetical protein
MTDQRRSSGGAGGTITRERPSRWAGGIILHPIPIPVRPTQNRCVYFGPRSTIETELEFKTFFDQEHTVAGWFMPQYALGGCHGPLFASSGTTRYFVGQGNYRSGDALISAAGLASNVSAKAGQPVLTVFAGSASRIYLAPAWKSGIWQHLAVVRRKSPNDQLELYLNGTKLQPVTVTTNTTPGGKVASKTVNPTSQLPMPASVTGQALGKLVFGHSDHPTVPNAYAQAYGLLDDVGVFDHALTDAEISTIFQEKRLSGYEKGLIAGWGFDTPAPGKLLPTKLRGPLDEFEVDSDLTVSGDRNNASDRAIFDNASVIAATTPVVKFPFEPGDVWAVIQEYCNPLVSHNGDSAAFCYDLSRPIESSGNTPVHACTGGYVYKYIRNAPNPNKTREANTVMLFTESYDLGVTYMHLAANSLTDAVVDGDPPAPDPSQWYTLWPNYRWVDQGVEIGKVGPYGNHLHTGGHESFVEGLSVQLAGDTIPIAYDHVEIKKPGGNWFTPSGPYIPKKDEQIRAKA